MPTKLTERTPNFAPLPTLRDVMQTPLRLDHLDQMLTEIGIWQHSEGLNPNPRHGYSIDDEARGLIVALHYWQAGYEIAFMRRLGSTCFKFIQDAVISQGPQAGRYHNFCDAEGRWLDSIGSDDSFGRTLWSLGIAHQVDAPFAPRTAAAALLDCSSPHIDALQPNFLRAHAFIALGLAASRSDDNRLHTLADDLVHAYEATNGTGWRWFENHMTYCNARLPQALFLAARVFPENPRYARIATESLDFLLDVMRDARGNYSPIGNDRLDKGGWFARGEARPPQWDQQPVDAGALVEACVDAFLTTGEVRFAHAARAAFGWYQGENWHGLPIYNPQTGAVADALHAHGMSHNLGAESVVSVHMAWQALQKLEH